MRLCKINTDSLKTIITLNEVKENNYRKINIDTPYDSDGYDSKGYDRDGYDRDGYDCQGFDRDGYNAGGYDQYGYDSEGYDQDSYNSEGYCRDGDDDDNDDDDDDEYLTCLDIAKNKLNSQKALLDLAKGSFNKISNFTGLSGSSLLKLHIEEAFYNTFLTNDMNSITNLKYKYNNDFNALYRSFVFKFESNKLKNVAELDSISKYLEKTKFKNIYKFKTRKKDIKAFLVVNHYMSSIKYKVIIKGSVADRVKFLDKFITLLRKVGDKKYNIIFSTTSYPNNKISNMENFDPFNINSQNNKIWDLIISDKKKEIMNYIDIWSKQYSNVGNNPSYSVQTGIILEGETGTGKTMTIRAIAQQLGYQITYIDFREDLKKQFSNINSYTVVAMEDIDFALGTGKRNSDTRASLKDKKTMLNVSELMNLIDGKTKYDHVVFVATTNDLNSLEKALVRPGRFNKTFYMGNFYKEQLKEAANRYKFGEEDVVNYFGENSMPSLVINTLEEASRNRKYYYNNMFSEFLLERKLKRKNN